MCIYHLYEVYKGQKDSLRLFVNAGFKISVYVYITSLFHGNREHVYPDILNLLFVSYLDDESEPKRTLIKNRIFSTEYISGVFLWVLVLLLSRGGTFI